MITVLDPIKGGITTDLKEKLTEAKASADSPVEKSFKGSLDVPALGIHKEVTDSGEEPENEVNIVLHLLLTFTLI